MNTSGPAERDGLGLGLGKAPRRYLGEPGERRALGRGDPRTEALTWHVLGPGRPREKASVADVQSTGRELGAHPGAGEGRLCRCGH